MRIDETQSTQPSLRNLGVSIQGASPTETAATSGTEQRERPPFGGLSPSVTRQSREQLERPPFGGLSPSVTRQSREQLERPPFGGLSPSVTRQSREQLELLTLAGLQLQQFESAYMVLPGARREALVLDPSKLDASRLLESLQQLGRRLDLDAALDLHGAASSLIAAMRGGTPEQTPLKLVLAGPFGEIELDLERLQPDALRSAFETGLQDQPAGDLQDIHRQLGPLSRRVRAGFSESDEDAQKAAARAEAWLAAALQAGFVPESLFQQALGHNPLNEESSVKQLLQSLGESPAGPVSAHSAEAAEDRAQAEAACQAELLENLVSAANALEEQLSLSPRPEGHDIMELLQHFIAILRQLDRDVNALLKQQSQRKQFDHSVLGQYAARLHRNLRLQGERLEALQASASERLKLLVAQAQTELNAKLWLAGESK